MKKTFKSLIAILLSLMLVAGTLCLSSFADDETVKFAVASDTHIDDIPETLEVNFPESNLYFHADGSGNLYSESTAITKQFLYDAAENGAQFILICGDLTRSGKEEQHLRIAQMFRSFTQETGVPVYVVPGNHDYFNSRPDDFKRYYAEFGYDNALVVDDKTASYVTDIIGNFRLIGVDSTNPGNDGDGIDGRLLKWIEAQVKQAKKDGKEIIYMMHHPLLEHLFLGRIIMKDFIVSNTDYMAEKFCDMGIKMVFTGHEHGNDVASFTGRKGNTVYDVLTTALTAYPLEYRMATYNGEEYKFEINGIDECDFDSLIDGYNDDQLALMESDYEEYARGCFRYAIEKKILKYTSPDFIKNKLKVTDGPVADVVDDLMSLVVEALDMPLYDNGEGVSIQSLAESKGVTIPDSGYKTLCELASAVVALHYHGDENMPSRSTPECEILVKGLNTGLEYILSNCGDGLNVLNMLVSETFGENSSEAKQLSKWFTAVKFGKEDSYKIAGQVLYPLLDNFTFDKAPGDRELTIKVNQDKSGISFADRILAIIRYIFNLFRGVFYLK